MIFQRYKNLSILTPPRLFDMKHYKSEKGPTPAAIMGKGPPFPYPPPIFFIVSKSISLIDSTTQSAS